MGVFKMIGMLFIVPTTVLLTTSFFVLVVNSKAESKGLKLFGWLVAFLLWVSAFVVFTTGMWFFENARDKVMGKGGIYISIGRRMTIRENAPGHMIKQVQPASATKSTGSKGPKTK